MTLYIPTNRTENTTPENAARDFAEKAFRDAAPQTPVTEKWLVERAALLRRRCENPDTAQAARDALFCTFLSDQGKVVQVRDF